MVVQCVLTLWIQRKNVHLTVCVVTLCHLNHSQSSRTTQCSNYLYGRHGNIYFAKERRQRAREEGKHFHFPIPVLLKVTVCVYSSRDFWHQPDRRWPFVEKLGCFLFLLVECLLRVCPPFLSVCLPVCPSACLIYLWVHVPVFLPVSLSACGSV